MINKKYFTKEQFETVLARNNGNWNVFRFVVVVGCYPQVGYYVKENSAKFDR